mgnify:FL=1
MSGRQYPVGGWVSGVGKAVHSLYGLFAFLPPESDTVWKSDTEEGAVSVGKLPLSVHHSCINQQNKCGKDCLGQCYVSFSYHGEDVG